MPTLKEFVDEHQLTIKAMFIPTEEVEFKDLKLQWKVAVLYKGRPILGADYSAGIAHCPSYKQNGMTINDEKGIRFECKTGKRATGFHEKIEPNPVDVIHCLISDADAIDFATFEDWADNCGYNPDSRKAEKVYRACLEIALKLRSALGETLLTQLREAAQDY